MVIFHVVVFTINVVPYGVGLMPVTTSFGTIPHVIYIIGHAQGRGTICVYLITRGLGHSYMALARNFTIGRHAMNVILITLGVLYLYHHVVVFTIVGCVIIGMFFSFGVVTQKRVLRGEDGNGVRFFLNNCGLVVLGDVVGLCTYYIAVQGGGA